MWILAIRVAGILGVPASLYSVHMGTGCVFNPAEFTLYALFSIVFLRPSPHHRRAPDTSVLRTGVARSPRI